MRLSTIFYLCLLTFTVFYGFYRYKNLSKEFKILVFLIIITIVQTIAGQILIKTIHNSYPSFHFYIIAAVIFHFYIYQQIHLTNRAHFISMLSLTVLVVGLSIYNSFTNQTLLEFPSIGIMLIGLQVIVFALIVYLDMLNHPLQTSIFKQPIFWLNTGNFVFYGITFSIFALYKFYIQSSNIPTWGHSLILYANIFLYSSYLYAIILDSNQKNERNSF